MWCLRCKQSPNAIVPGTHCFPQPLTTAVTIHHPPYYFGAMHIVVYSEFWILLQTTLTYYIYTHNINIVIFTNSTCIIIYAIMHVDVVIFNEKHIKEILITCRDRLMLSPAFHGMVCTKQITAFPPGLLLDPSSTSTRLISPHHLSLFFFIKPTYIYIYIKVKCNFFFYHKVFFIPPIHVCQFLLECVWIE